MRSATAVLTYASADGLALEHRVGERLELGEFALKVYVVQERRLLLVKAAGLA